MSATNPDSKRPRLESWASTSSPLSREIHHTHAQRLPPQNSSTFSATSPTFNFGDWRVKAAPQQQQLQKALSRSRSHSVPTVPPGIVPGGKDGTLQQRNIPQQQQQHLGHPSHANPLAHNSPSASSHGYSDGFQSQNLQSQGHQVSMDPSSAAPSSAVSAPHLRNAIDQQQLRSFSASSNSSASAGHPAHYLPDASTYYGQQVQNQRQPDGSSAGNAVMGGNGQALLDNTSPASSTPLHPGPSPIMTGSFSTNPTGIMNHQHMAVSTSGLVSPAATTPTVGIQGAMMGNNPQMNVVTTYPPRRKAIRAAQACDACRARKAKCDEGRPSCGFCKESQIPCVYREVPPPKQDRTLLQILERLGRVETLLDSVCSGRMEAVVSAGARTAATNEAAMAINEARGAADTLPVQNHHSYSRPIKPIEVPLDGDEQLTIPVQHNTAAHKLLLWWSIRKNIDEKFLVNETYVVQEEEDRGLLHVYGRGETLNSPESMFEDTDGHDTGVVWDSGIGVDEGTGGSWRNSEDLPMEDGLSETGEYTSPRWKPAGYAGSGMTTGGGLKLDHQTVLALLNSFLANIHAIHPIVDKAAITNMVFSFSERVASASAASPTAPHSAVAPGHNVGLGLGSGGDGDGSMASGPHRRNSSAAKRKRSISGVGPAPSMPFSQSMGPTPQRIPRTLHSALVLLVLALGAICLHRRPVPGPLPPLSNSPGPRTTTLPFKTPSPSNHGASSPFYSYNQQSGGSQGRQGRELRNIDVIPGLAYFGKAIEIIGVFAGGNELENVQVSLLAGLYWGQLGRVLDSWKWINYACISCQILVRVRLERESSDLRKDLILRVFWSCLQLESDLLAELDVPPSGISRLEDSMPLPGSVKDDSLHAEGITDNAPSMWLYFLAQNALRKLLNRAHTSLYKKDKAKLDSPGSLLLARELDFQLERWRDLLPEELRWQESDPPSSDINAARLRAKYFGARYIIHRPFVYHAIHGGNGVYNAPGGGPFSTSSPARSTSDMSQSSPSATTPGGPSSSRRISVAGEGERAESLVPVSLEASCRKCLDSAISSTTAFHAFSVDDNRPIITNVFGTAHAQFGNLLVLQAAYQSPALKSMVSPLVLAELFQKTIHWLQTLSPISPALCRDARILESAAAKLDFPINIKR